MAEPSREPTSGLTHQLVGDRPVDCEIFDERMLIGAARRVSADWPPVRQRVEPLAALVACRHDEARVVQAARGWSRPVFAASVEAFRALIGRIAPVSCAALLVARDEAGRPSAPLVAELKQAYPGFALLAYCDSRGPAAGDVVAMARAGVHALVFRCVDDVSPTLREVIESARRLSAAELVMTLLRQYKLERDALSLVDTLVSNVARFANVAGAAAFLGIHRRTFVSRCKRLGLPGPEALIGYCRLFIAAGILNASSSSIESVARIAGFVDGASLRHRISRVTGQRLRLSARRALLQLATARFVEQTQRARKESVSALDLPLSMHLFSSPEQARQEPGSAELGVRR